MYKGKVLVVDDDDEVRNLITMNLEAGGFEVEGVSTGREALKVTEVFGPDVVVLDVIMPDMDGWEVCKILKDKSGADGKIKILILTALSSGRDILIGKEILKADEYLTKPFDIEILIRKIRLLLIRND